MRIFLTLAALTCAAAPLPALTSPALAQEQSAAEKAHMETSMKVVQSLINAERTNDLKRYFAHFAEDALFVMNGQSVRGRAKMLSLRKQAIAAGLVSDNVKTTKVEVLNSGWTGTRIFVLAREHHSSGIVLDTYAEYEVRNGKVIALYGTV